MRKRTVTMIKTGRKLCISLTVAAVVSLTLIEIFRPAPFENAKLNESFFVILTRLIGAALFLFLIKYLSYDILSPKYVRGKAVLYALPCFAVAINNLPYVALFAGDATVSASAAELIFFAVECVLVATFEEFAFRGVLFCTLLKKCDSRRKIVGAIVISSAIFGLFHLVNLIYSADVGGVLLQVGYSALVGAMCAFVLFKTNSVWLCAAIHAIYNFCGQIVPRLGGGNMLNLPQIIITVIISVFCAIYIILSILKTDVSPDKQEN